MLTFSFPINAVLAASAIAPRYIFAHCVNNTQCLCIFAKVMCIRVFIAFAPLTLAPKEFL